MSEIAKVNGAIAPGADKPHFSPTQIDMGTRCMEAYRRRYFEGEKIPPGIAALAGKGVHGGAERNFRQKIETREDLPAQEIIDAAVDKFDAETKGEYSLTPEERSRGIKTVIAENRDQVADLARLHAAVVAPQYQPLFVEETVRLTLPASHDLLGVIDLVAEGGIVADHKVSGRKKQQDEADHSIQLTTYAAAHRVLTGELPREVRLEVLIKKQVPERQILRSTRGIRDFEVLVARINAMMAAVNAGIFQPSQPGNWWCSEKWCGYWSTCPYVNAQPKLYSLEPSALPAPVAPEPTADEKAKIVADVEDEFGDPYQGDADHLRLMPLPGQKVLPTFDTPPFDLPEGVEFVPAEQPAKKTKRKNSYKNPRERLMAQDPHCKWCGCQLSMRSATLDHVVPLEQGGKNEEENYCLACRKCNLERAATGSAPEFVSNGSHN